MLRIKNATFNLYMPPSLAAVALARYADGEETAKPTKLPRIGSVWEEQGGIYLGNMPHERGDYALILPTDPAASIKKAAWGLYGQDITGATSNNDGHANTVAMAEAGSEIAKQALAADLYLMSRNEARLAFIAAPDQFDKEVAHWTSTQCSAYDAWYQNFNNGTQGNSTKKAELAVRFVRRFFL